MKTALISTFCIALLVPVLVSAHPNHTASMPDHPVGSPDYHETAETVGDTDSASDAVLRAALIALITELLAQLGLSDAMLSNGGSNDVTTSTVSGDIKTVGSLQMSNDGNYRYFSSDGLPEYDISGNRYANTASAQNHDFRVALNPVRNSQPTYYGIPYNFGIALNGVTFEPYAAEWYQNDRNSGWQEDPFVTLPDLDAYNAHVQPSGLYHYHGQPTHLIDGDRNTHSSLVGFAADGFPIYGPYVHESDESIVKAVSGWELRSGTRSGGPGGTFDGTYNEDYEYVGGMAGDLDECNGRFAVTPEFLGGTYYYVATEDFPYIPRCLMGDMDPSFATGPGPR